jgi:hypothetical protein
VGSATPGEGELLFIMGYPGNCTDLFTRKEKLKLHNLLYSLL